MSPKKPERFPLMIYQLVAKRWRTPILLTIPAGIFLWGAQGYRTTFADSRTMLLLLIPICGMLLTLYILLAQRAAIVCHDTYFTIQTPIFPVNFSYRRLEAIRPTEFGSLFPPTEEKRAHLRLFQELWGKTAIVLDLKGYPMPEWWLQLWFPRYLWKPKGTGLVIMVEEWMALSRQIEMRRTALLENRRTSRGAYTQ